MKVKNVCTTVQEMDRSEIDTQLNKAITMTCDRLIEDGVAQHRDEARILIEKALHTPSVQHHIKRAAEYKLESGEIGFEYDNQDIYKNNPLEKAEKGSDITHE